MIRRALGSGRRRAGCSAAPAPVAGSTRMMVPSRETGSPAGAQVLAAQRAPFGGRRRQRGAGPARRVAAGVDRAAVLAVVDEVEAGAVAAAGVERAVGAELQGADRVAGVLLAPVLDQHLLGAGHHVAGGLQARQAPADHAAVGGRAGRGRAGVGVDAGASPSAAPGRPSRARGRRCRGRRRRGRRGSSGARAMPSSPRSQKLWTLAFRSAKTSGVVSVRESKTLMTPALLGHEDPPVGGEADGGGIASAR